MESHEGIITTEYVSPEIVYQQDKAQTDVQISTAKAYPRNIKRSVDNAIAVVTMDAATAATCTYSLPRGGKAITGPSVHLAKILAQVWGNLRVEAKVVSIDNTTITSQSVCFDLENNLAIKVEVKRSIMTKTGRMNDDMITVTGNAANAIALRNSVLSVIPKAVVDKVYTAAKATITGDVSDEQKFLKRRKEVFDALRDNLGVSEKEVLDAIGKASIANITQEDLVTIIGIGQAIKDGDTTVELSFRSGKKVTSAPLSDVTQAKERQNIIDWINLSDTLEKLKQVSSSIPDDDEELVLLYDDKKRILSKKNK